MAELIKGKKYKIKSLYRKDDHRDRGLEGRVMTLYECYDTCCVFRDDIDEKWVLDIGFEVEECCGEGCCDVPPRNAEAYTMDETDYLLSTKANKYRLEESIQQTELDFKSIPDLKESLDHNDKISEVFAGLHDLLQYKNSKYGNSGIEPINVFSKVPAETGLLQRLDDKIARIKNSPELRKNDAADVIGYIVLLCVTKGWTHFDEFKD